VLTEVQKEPYHQQASQDKLRYEKEMAEFTANGFYINSKGENSRDLFQPKLSDDIVKPKKPTTAFIYFSLENRKKILEANSEVSVSDIAKLNGQAWNKMPESSRQKYHKMAEVDKLRHKEQMDQLMSQGFFVTAEGVKSTDLATKKKRGSIPDGKRKAHTQPDEAEISKKSPKRVKKE
jgi:hypothetical protein